MSIFPKLQKIKCFWSNLTYLSIQRAQFQLSRSITPIYMYVGVSENNHQA